MRQNPCFDLPGCIFVRPDGDVFDDHWFWIVFALALCLDFGPVFEDHDNLQFLHREAMFSPDMGIDIELLLPFGMGKGMCPYLDELVILDYGWNVFVLTHTIYFACRVVFEPFGAIRVGGAGNLPALHFNGQGLLVEGLVVVSALQDLVADLAQQCPYPIGYIFFDLIFIPFAQLKDPWRHDQRS